MTARILVVDDELSAQTLLKVVLAQAGYSVSTASSGPEALDLIRADPPDLVVLDVMMPGMDGFEVLRRIRSDERTAALPVIMLSAKGQIKDRVLGLRSGADDYIPKPADNAELVARIEAVLTRSARAQMGPTRPSGRVIAFVGAKGGVGTTTAAINTAAVAARRHRTALIELRLHTGSMATFLNLQPRWSLLDVFDEEGNLRPDGLRQAVIPHASGFYVLPAPIGIPPRPPSLNASAVQALLEELRATYQVVILDALPDAELLDPIISKVDVLTLVIAPDPATTTLGREMLSMLKAYAEPQTQFHIIIVNRAPGLPFSTAELSRQFGHSIDLSIPFAPDRCAAGIRSGIPIVAAEEDDLLKMTFTEMAERLLHQSEGLPSHPTVSDSSPVKRLFRGH